MKKLEKAISMRTENLFLNSNHKSDAKTNVHVILLCRPFKRIHSSIPYRNYNTEEKYQ